MGQDKTMRGGDEDSILRPRPTPLPSLLQRDQFVARECCLAMLAMDEQVQTMSIEERRVVVEPIEVLEDIPLDENNLEKYIKVGASMERKTKQNLV